jgi:methylated-DNA-[protein]-cysteine S-methyltransferase
VAATGAGIVAVDLGSETPDFVDGLARRLHGRVLPAEDGAVPAGWRATLNAATIQIGEWLAGGRTAFDVPIDLRVSEWDRLVLTGAARLQYGETVGYGELARRIGRPGAAQAVGGAMGRNPVPILIPCHRVIAGDGTLGGYGGSTYADRQAALAIKRRLLAVEGATVRVQALRHAADVLVVGPAELDGVAVPGHDPSVGRQDLEASAGEKAG